MDLWLRARALAVRIFRLISEFPREYRFILTDQIRKCAVSIPANIAEGTGRPSPVEFIRFLYIALASACEHESHLTIGGNPVLRFENWCRVQPNRMSPKDGRITSMAPLGGICPPFRKHSEGLSKWGTRALTGRYAPGPRGGDPGDSKDALRLHPPFTEGKQPNDPLLTRLSIIDYRFAVAVSNILAHALALRVFQAPFQ